MKLRRTDYKIAYTVVVSVFATTNRNICLKINSKAHQIASPNLAILDSRDSYSNIVQ